MKNLELSNVELYAIGDVELQEINGGGFFKGLSITFLIQGVIENWEDCKAGFKAGYNHVY